MTRRSCLLTITIMLGLIGILSGCIRGAEGDSAAVAEQGTSHVTVDPRVEEALTENESVKVLISLRDLDELEAVPMAEWTEELLSGIDWDLRAQHAQEVQAIVRAALGPEDATQIVGFETLPGLAATITASGLEILRNHPYVAAVGAAELGSLE